MVESYYKVVVETPNFSETLDSVERERRTYHGETLQKVLVLAVEGLTIHEAYVAIDGLEVPD
jgi:hypothetical protein